MFFVLCNIVLLFWLITMALSSPWGMVPQWRDKSWVVVGNLCTTFTGGPVFCRWFESQKVGEVIVLWCYIARIRCSLFLHAFISDHWSLVTTVVWTDWCWDVNLRLLDSTNRKVRTFFRMGQGHHNDQHDECVVGVVYSFPSVWLIWELMKSCGEPTGWTNRRPAGGPSSWMWWLPAELREAVTWRTMALYPLKVNATSQRWRFGGRESL